LARHKIFYWLFIIILILVGCSSQPDTQTPSIEPNFTETPAPTATLADTPTPLSPVGVFLTPPESDPSLVEELNPLVGGVYQG